MDIVIFKGDLNGRFTNNSKFYALIIQGTLINVEIID